MKKISLLIFVVVFSLTQLAAQKSTFVSGDKVFNFGIGLGSTYYSGFYTSRMPAITGSFEVGVSDEVLEKGSIGVGGYFGYSSARYSNYWKTSNFIIGGRGSFHYPLVEKLDTYTGLLLGYNIYSTQRDINYHGIYAPSSSQIAVAWFAGARYYFNDNIAGLAEIGYGIAYLTLGIAIKL
jgi:hypothetical protein